MSEVKQIIFNEDVVEEILIILESNKFVFSLSSATPAAFETVSVWHDTQNFI